MKKEFGTAQIKCVLTEPWELVTTNGSGPFEANVLRKSADTAGRDNALLLEFSAGFKSGDTEYSYFVATTRHESTALDQLFSGARVVCNLIGIPAEKALSAHPFDLSQWRGGMAAIADLTLVSEVG